MILLFGSLFGTLQGHELRLQLHLHPGWGTISRSSQACRIGPQGKLEGREAPASLQPAAGISLLRQQGFPCCRTNTLRTASGTAARKQPWCHLQRDALAQSCAGRLLTSELSSGSKASEIQHCLRGYRAVILEEFYLARGTALDKMFSQASLGSWTDLSSAQPCEGLLCRQLRRRSPQGRGLPSPRPRAAAAPPAQRSGPAGGTWGQPLLPRRFICAGGGAARTGAE